MVELYNWINEVLKNMDYGKIDVEISIHQGQVVSITKVVTQKEKYKLEEKQAEKLYP